MAKHDLVVIGAGPGGYAVGFRAAVRGLDVAMVEADKIGGTCLHRGCIPSKALLHVAGVVEETQRDELGINASIDGFDLDRLRGFRDHVVGTMHKGMQGLVKARGITYHEGRGRILEPGVVEVTADNGSTERVEATHVVIATGSAPRGLPGIDVDGDVVVTSTEALRVDRIPERALVIGAGAIGLEFSTLWHAFGAEVVLVEALDRVLPLEDSDSSRVMARVFKRRGVDVLTSATVSSVRVADGAATVTIETADGEREEVADTVLVAIGRAPNTEGSGAAELGLLDEKGFVVTDELGRAKGDDVWAVGDLTAGLQLAHSAFAEGFVVADAIAAEDDVAPVDHTQVPRVTYCSPEVASVGLTEGEARERFDDVETTTYSMRANAKGLITGTDGHVKVVHRGSDAETLGVHVVAPHATDVIGEATAITYWGAYPSEVARIVHAHPTLYEAIGEAFLAADGTPFHTH